MTKIVSSLALGLALALSLSGPSGAAKSGNSTVLISKKSGGHRGADGIRGRVISKRADCIEGRTVNLYWLGRDGAHPIGFAKTDARGRWKLDIPIVHGGHSAALSAQGSGANRCDRDTAKRRI